MPPCAIFMIFSKNILNKNCEKLLTKKEISVIITKSQVAGMAQSVEHVIGNDEVISSILITSSKSPTQKRRAFHI